MSYFLSVGAINDFKCLKKDTIIIFSNDSGKKHDYKHIIHAFWNPHTSPSTFAQAYKFTSKKYTEISYGVRLRHSFYIEGKRPFHCGICK